MHDFDILIKNAISEHQIQILDNQFSLNYKNFEKYENDLDHQFNDQSFELLNTQEIDKFLDPQLDGLKKVSKEIFNEFESSNQLIPLKLTTLFRMYLILEINSWTQELNEDHLKIWEKMQDFFNWDSSELESLKSKIENSNSQIWGYGLLIITIFTKLFLSSINSSPFKNTSNDLIFGLIFLALIGLSIYLIFSSKKLDKISENKMYYPIEIVLKKFNELNQIKI